MQAMLQDQNIAQLLKQLVTPVTYHLIVLFSLIKKKHLLPLSELYALQPNPLIKLNLFEL